MKRGVTVVVFLLLGLVFLFNELSGNPIGLSILNVTDDETLPEAKLDEEIVVMNSRPQSIEPTPASDANLPVSLLPAAPSRSTSQARGTQATCSSCATCQTCLGTSNTYCLLTASDTVSGACLTFTADNVALDCGGNTITYANSATGDALSATSRRNITIVNCTIVQGSSASNSQGVVLDNTNDVVIRNTTIQTLDSSSEGVQFLNVVNGTIVINSSIHANNNNAISLGDARNFSLNRSVLSSGATAGSTVSSNGGGDHVFLNSVIRQTGSDDALKLTSLTRVNVTNSTLRSVSGRALELEGSSRVRLENNSLLAHSGETIALTSSSTSNVFLNNTLEGNGTLILFSSSTNSLFNQTILNGNFTWLTTDASSSGNNITLTTFNKSNGSILLLNLSTIPVSTIVNGSNLNISSNNSFLNSSNLTFLNTSAQITLRALSFTDPQSLIDIEDDGTFALCNPPDCTEVSYAGGTFVFNVSHFTSHASRETQAGFTPSCPYFINVNTTMDENLTCPSTAFIFNSSNTVLDCAGNNVTYGTNGTNNVAGVNATSRNNVTIRNCRISHGAVIGTNAIAVSLINTHNSSILNNNISNDGDNNSDGIRLDTSSNNNSVRNNSIVTNGSGTTSIAFRNDGNSDLNSFVNNSVFTRDFGAGIANSPIRVTSGSGNVTIENNTILTTSGQAIGMFVAGTFQGTIIRNNTVNVSTNESGWGINIGDFAHNTTMVRNTVYVSSTFGGSLGLISDSGADDSFIANNTLVLTNGLGIIADDSDSTDILENAVQTFSSIDTSTGIFVGASRGLRVERNNVSSNGTGISVENSDTLIVADNIVQTNGSAADHVGILLATSTSIQVARNRVTTNGTGAFYWGIGLDNTSSTNVTFNNITTNGSNQSMGIRLDRGSNNSIVANNRITTNGIGNSNFGISVSRSIGVVVQNNVVSTFGVSTNHGLRVVSFSNNTRFINNTISTQGTESYGVAVGTNAGDGADVNHFNGTRLVNVSQWIIVMGSNRTNFTNTTFETLNGSINVPANFTLNGTLNVTKTKLNILLNNSLLNSTNLSELNTSARITLNGLSFTDPQPLIDIEDDGTFAFCNPPDCVEDSYAGGIFVFNVTHFTSHASRETSSTPTIGQVILNSSNGSGANGTAASSENLTLFIINASGAVRNITDWRIFNQSSMVLNVPFETNVSVNTTGAIRDYTSFAHNGTLGNGSAGTLPVWNQTAILGGGYSFDGVNDIIDFTNTTDFDFSNASGFTVEAWAIPTGLTPTQGDLVCKWDPEGFTDTRAFALERSNGPNIWQFRVSYNGSDFGGATNALSTTNATVGSIAHVVGRFDGRNVAIFINGTLEQQTAAAVPGVKSSPDRLIVGGCAGKANESTFNVFNGTISEARIYRRALSNAQIAQLYVDGSAGRLPTAFVSQETFGGERWSVLVTPHDGTSDGTTVASNNVTILGVNANLTKRDLEDPVFAHFPFTYTVTINASNGTMSNITLTETYPPHVIFLGSEPAPSSGNNTFTIGNLTNATFQINISLNVSPAVPHNTVLTNVVNISFNDEEGVLNTLSDTETTTAQQPTDCTFSVNASITTNQTCTNITVNTGVILNTPAWITFRAIDNVVINAGAVLNGTGSGFAGGIASSGNGQGPGGGTATRAGGAHGGLGGGSTVRPYGRSLIPVTLGSGGKAGNSNGGSGGGAILINATIIMLNGTIDASGVNGFGDGVNQGGGGGAGGSIALFADTLSGTGRLFARGGNGGTDGSTGTASGGSGGRIMAQFNSLTFSITNATVAGGSGATGAGQPGTLGFSDINDGTLTILDGWRWQSDDLALWNFTIVNITNAFTRTNVTFLNFSVSRFILSNSRFTSDNGSVFNVTLNATTFTMNPSNITNVSILNISAVNFSMDAGSLINNSRAGFVGGLATSGNGQGPGGGTVTRAGAAHGGLGSAYPPAQPYGSSLNPVTLGSGGKAGNHAGGDGGGAVIITAVNADINGTINVDGGTGAGDGVNQGGGGGAGGSINIIANVFNGTGTLLARGGNGGTDGTTGTSGGGSGGRIMARFNTSNFPITNASVAQGTGGTASLQGQVGTLGFLDIDDNIFTTFGGWRWQADDASVWNFTTINISSSHTRTNDTQLNFSVSRFILSNSRFTSDNGSVFNVTLNATTFTMNPSNITNVSILNISAVNFSIEAGSVINSTGSGFAGGLATSGNGQGPGGGIATRAGGAHGGLGGGSTVVPYGSSLNPVTLGSGGKAGNHAGGAGGGAVIISALNMDLNGTIDATGATGAGDGVNQGGGGGSGGTINILASVFNGTGVLFARGGNGGTDGTTGTSGGGSGGRIMARFNASNFSIANASVSGGSGGSGTGQAGTLGFLKSNTNVLTLRQSWRWQDNDEPFAFVNVTVDSGATTRSNASALNITDTYFDSNSTFIVENRTLVLNATRFTALNVSFNATGSTRLSLGYRTHFDDSNSTYLLGMRLNLRNISVSEVNWSSFTALVGNLSTHTRLRDNFVRVNSTAQPGLNVSANITLYNISVPDPFPIFDDEDDGTFSTCSPPRCTELSYSGSTFIFNVSRFTTYSSAGGVNFSKSDSPDPVTAGSTLLYTILINNTNGNITNVTVVETYPSQVVFNGSQPSPTTGNNTFVIGNLTANQTFQINITVNVSSLVPNGTVINNTANLTFQNLSGASFNASVTENTTVLVAQVLNVSNLSIVKTDSPDPVARGTNLSYQIQINSTGNASAFNVTIFETYPPNVTFVTSQPAPTSGNNTFTIGNLTPGSSFLVNITVTVGGTVANGTVLNNSAVVSFFNLSGSNNSVNDSELTTVIGQPLLATSKSDSPDPVLRGATLSYQILVNNTGDDYAFNVTVFESYPAGTVFNGSSPAPTSGNSTFNLGTRAPNQSIILNITLNVSSSVTNGTLLNNSYNVTFNNSLAQSANTTNSTLTLVLGFPQLNVTKIDSPDPVNNGSTLVYTITVTNTGDDYAFNVTVLDILPVNVTFNGSSIAPISGNDTYSLGNLTPNQSVNFTITVNVSANMTSGTLLNNATVNFTNSTGQLLQASATQTTTVTAPSAPSPAPSGGGGGGNVVLFRNAQINSTRPQALQPQQVPFEQPQTEQPIAVTEAKPAEREVSMRENDTAEELEITRSDAVESKPLFIFEIGKILRTAAIPAASIAGVVLLLLAVIIIARTPRRDNTLENFEHAKKQVDELDKLLKQYKKSRQRRH